MGSPPVPREEMGARLDERILYTSSLLADRVQSACQAVQRGPPNQVPREALVRTSVSVSLSKTKP